jgi:hypothetical protein
MKYPKQWKVTLRHREDGDEKTVMVDWCLTRDEVLASARANWPAWEVISTRYQPPVKPSRQELEARRTRRLAARRERENPTEES